ncbi:hypothetical protein GH714_002824 [Hevea brasiliensis]|uniref:Uncharacterized protein n=1 Tax=Hevea brasiliensis TaxID=3981 RepID=A0A6A6N8T0_HEVBR|nr:hypothetical protein GH714_002824 [Hevea brasiliensis]
MTESPSQDANDVATTNPSVPEIPIEIVSEEEMALIEAALAATRSCLSSSVFPAICSPSSSSLFLNNARSIRSITSLSKRRVPGGCSESDIEDLGSTQKKNPVAESLFHRFRKRRGLSVTDITSAEWCEKQTEFGLLFGKIKITKAMKAGHDRHVKLEEEVVKRVKVSVESAEDAWALKFINFITCANQLLFEGLTRFGLLKLVSVGKSFLILQNSDCVILHTWDLVIFDRTLDDVVRYFRNTCSMLLPADNQMLLRYELQKDNSVIGEDQFAYDPDWLNGQIQGSLKFWLVKEKPVSLLRKSGGNAGFVNLLQYAL